MTDLPAEYKALRCAYADAVAQYNSHDFDTMAHERLAQAALDSFVAGLVRERDDFERKLIDANGHLGFVERWANHHSHKANFTDHAALSAIQHYPPIKAITKRYVDGHIPDTYDPYADRDQLRADLAACRAELAEAKRDAERLDLLDRHCRDNVVERDMCGDPELVAMSWHIEGPVMDVRSCIDGNFPGLDAALKETGDGK